MGSPTTNVDNLGGHCYWEGAHTRLIKTHKQQPGERYQTPARQQVNGSSGTFDEILSNHSPGFTMSRVTSPKFPGPAILEGRVFRQDTFRKMGPLLLDSIVIVKRQFRHGCQSCIVCQVVMACAGGTWLNSPLLPGLTPNALSRPKDGGLVAVLFLVLRSSVIFTVAAELLIALQGPLDFCSASVFPLRRSSSVSCGLDGTRRCNRFSCNWLVSCFSPGR